MVQTPLRVLLVEDDPTVCRAAERYLTHRGHELVAIAGTCRHALADVRTFDCVLMDVDLPDGNGVDVARQLLERGTTNVVVFFSGTQDQDIRLAASELGTFVAKEAGLHALVKAMETAVVEVNEQALAANGDPVSSRDSEPRLQSGFRRTR